MNKAAEGSGALRRVAPKRRCPVSRVFEHAGRRLLHIPRCVRLLSLDLLPWTGWQRVPLSRFVTLFTSRGQAISSSLKPGPIPNGPSPRWENCQSLGIARQARDIARRTGVRLDRTERVANSLGKLAGMVTRLNDELRNDVKVRRRLCCRTASRQHVGHLDHVICGALVMLEAISVIPAFNCASVSLLPFMLKGPQYIRCLQICIDVQHPTCKP